MASSAGSSGSPFPRWQLAIALGATGAIGFGYWYMKNYNAKAIDKTKLLDADKKQISLDDSQTESKQKPKSLLQQAINHKTEGNEYFRRGTYDKAIACYTKAIETCPLECANELSTFYQNRAAAYEQLKKYSSVIEDCTKALEYNKSYVKALLRRARAYESIKDWSECLDDLTAVCLMQRFQDQTALFMADRVLKELGRKHAIEAMATRIPITPSKNFIKTYFLSFSEDPAYKLIYEKFDDVDDSKGFLRARKAFLNNNFDDIIPACTEEIETSESQYKLESLLLRGTFHLLRGSHELALMDLAELISNENVDIKIRVNALIKRASLFMQLEKPEECINGFNLAAELGPNISDVFHHRGQVNLLIDKIDDAMSDFNLAVSLNPDFPIAYVQKCYCDYRHALNISNQDKIMEAIGKFSTACEKFPNCSECFTLYAQVLADQQQFEKANEYYEKALNIDDSNATVYVHKGLLQLQWTANTEMAVKMMNNAIEKDPLCEFAYETLGTVEVQRGNLQNAVDLFDKAVKLAKTELEMAHLYSLRDAAVSQLKTSKRYGLSLPYAS